MNSGTGIGIIVALCGMNVIVGMIGGHVNRQADAMERIAAAAESRCEARVDGSDEMAP